MMGKELHACDGNGANGKAKQQLELSRVRDVILADASTMAPAHDRQAGVVWFKNGSRLVGREMVIDSADEGTVTIEPTLESTDAPKGGLKWPLSAVSRVDVTSGSHRLVNLVQLPRKVLSMDESWGMTFEPMVREGALWLHGPLKLQLELPAGATRVAATVELALPSGLPTTRQAWADCDLVISLAGENGQTPRQVARYHLHAEQLSARINFPIENPSMNKLILEIENGANGPILDRVRLRDGAVLVRDAAK
jgi:hypothetical protein